MESKEDLMKFRGLFFSAALLAALFTGGCSTGSVNIFGWMEPGLDTKDVNALIARGDTEVNKGNYSNALTFYTNALAIEPTNALALEGSCTAYLFTKVPIKSILEMVAAGGALDFSKIGIANFYSAAKFIAPKLELIAMGKATKSISSNSSGLLVNYFIFNTINAALEIADLSGDGNLISNTNNIIYFTNDSPLGYVINGEITNTLLGLTNGLMGDLTNALPTWTNYLISNAMSNVDVLTNRIFSNLNNGINELTNMFITNIFAPDFDLTNEPKRMESNSLIISNMVVNMSNLVLALEANSNNFLGMSSEVASLKETQKSILSNINFVTNRIREITNQIGTLAFRLSNAIDTNLSNFITTNLTNVLIDIKATVTNYISNFLMPYIDSSVFTLLDTNITFNAFLSNAFVRNLLNIAPKFNRFTNALNNSVNVIGRFTNSFQSKTIKDLMVNLNDISSNINEVKQMIADPTKLLATSGGSVPVDMEFISAFLTNTNTTKASLISNFITLGKSFLTNLGDLDSMIPSDFTNQLNTYKTNLSVFDVSSIANIDLSQYSSPSNYKMPDIDAVFSNMNNALTLTNIGNIMNISNSSPAVVLTTLLSNAGATNLATLATQLTNANTNAQVGTTNQIMDSTVTMITNTYPDQTNNTAALYAALSNQYGLTN